MVVPESRKTSSLDEQALTKDRSEREEKGGSTLGGSKRNEELEVGGKLVFRAVSPIHRRLEPHWELIVYFSGLFTRER